MLLEQGLVLDKQVAMMAKGTFHQLQLVSQQWPSLSKKDLAIVIHALVKSGLDYCNAFYIALPLKNVQKL